jgi:hypothetical protein
MKSNLEYIIPELREIIYYYENSNIISEILKITTESKILLGLTYALGISIKTIILVFLFI